MLSRDVVVFGLFCCAFICFVFCVLSCCFVALCDALVFVSCCVYVVCMFCVCSVYVVCMLCVCGRCTSDVCNAAAPSALITWPPIFLYFSHRWHQQSIFDIWYQIRWPPIFPYFYHRWHQQSIFNIWYQITWPPIFPYFSHRWHQHKSWSNFIFRITTQHQLQIKIISINISNRNNLNKFWVGIFTRQCHIKQTLRS